MRIVIAVPTNDDYWTNEHIDEEELATHQQRYAALVSQQVTEVYPDAEVAYRFVPETLSRLNRTTVDGAFDESAFEPELAAVLEQVESIEQSVFDGGEWDR